jgi:hypothetical protein
LDTIYTSHILAVIGYIQVDIPLALAARNILKVGTFWYALTSLYCSQALMRKKNQPKYCLCPAALHTIANISMRIFPISLSFLVSGILFF